MTNSQELPQHRPAHNSKVLLQQLLSPLERSLGQVGSLAMAPLTQSIAAHDTGGFGSVLAAFFEKHDAG